jgi:hypothetical protein
MKSCFFKIACVVAAIGLVTGRVAACPFCNPEQPTLTEDTKGADAVVLAKLLKEAPAPADATDPNSGMAKFKVVEVLRGQDVLKDAQEIEVVFFGDNNREQTYLVNGIGKDKTDWTTPLPLSPTAVKYVKQLPTVAAAGADRLAFFQDYLEHEDPLLAQDAYDEFARAPYADVQGLGPRMQHDRIVKWIVDPEVSPSRRRLYLTMLGICGSKADVPMLESMIASDILTIKPVAEQMAWTAMNMGGPIGLPVWIEAVQQEERRKKLGLDALVACYLILRGPDGLDLVENRFLKNPKAEYTHIYSTIMALRFHGDENTKILPKERLLSAMRLLLENPEFSDQVILDLSRWEDWSVLDKLVEMFKKSDEKGYVRQPVVSYLTVASEQKGDVGVRAKTAMEELERLDPETVKTARSLIAFGALGRARGVASAKEGEDKPQAEKEGGLATVGATDAKQGFAASPEDEKSDPAQIPDPAGFDVSEKSSGESTPAATEKPESAEVKSEKDMTAAKVPAETPAVKAGAPAARPAAIAVDRMNPLVVAGVPVLAAGLLMGVYWLILRAGAV